jgi:hypothetical protein
MMKKPSPHDRCGGLFFGASMIPEAAASASATANKIAGGGYLITVVGWLSNATTVALVGLAITVLGGAWGFLAYLQNRRNAKAKRAEDAEEHAIRMNLLNIEMENALREKARLDALESANG